MNRWQKNITIFGLLLLFTSLFFRNINSDLPLIFEKDLRAHDESSNSVVSANITRKFFPPMVRVNPLVHEQGNWMEGPYWQHIPPMFAYVPYFFYQFDGQITIEVKRLSFAALQWLSGTLFILFCYLYNRRISTALSATIATMLWLQTPFTHALVTGYVFGVSDIVLAFTVVLAFGAILWYLKYPRVARINSKWYKIVLISIAVALPIMAKSLLGAIPAATLFMLLIRDYVITVRLDSKYSISNLMTGVITFVGAILAYYLPLYFASPSTFNKEILTAIFHLSNLEGWGRPWHFYISHYLPESYLFKYSWVYLFGLTFSVYLYIKYAFDRKEKIIFSLPLIWFVWNLVAISLVESKIANFIYQTYLLSLFGMIFGLIEFHKRKIGTLFGSHKTYNLYVVGLIIISSLSFIKFSGDLFQGLRQHRAQAYEYRSENEKFYQTAEKLRTDGADTRSLIIARISDNDCWFRYYPLFLTGSESKALIELSFGYSAESIKNQYTDLYFIDSNLSFNKFDLSTLTVSEIKILIDQKLNENSDQIKQDIQRIKRDITTCQWLVPDHILNAD